MAQVIADDLVKDTTSSAESGRALIFPNDLPTIEELREYVPPLLAKISSMNLAAYMRGAEPSYVLQYKERDLSLLPELEGGAGEGAKETRLALRANVMHENSIKADMKREWARDQKQKVASVVLESMRHTAVSRFDQMKASHPLLDAYGCAIPGAFDGIAMALELVAELESTTVEEDDAIEHQRLVDLMFASKLGANCTLRAYSEKVTTMRTKHNPFLERKYENSGLSRVYQSFLPDELQVDARAIRREMETAGTWQDSDVALSAFSKLVKQMHSPAAHAAAVIAAAAATGGKGAGKGGPPGKGGGRAGGGRVNRGCGRGRGGAGAAPGAAATPPNSPPWVPSCILPNDEWCSSKTCHFNHDVTRPGHPCHRNSQVKIHLPKSMWENKAHVEKLKNARLSNHQFYGLPGQPKPVHGPKPGAQRARTDAHLGLPDDINAAGDASMGALSFMFDVGSPDVIDAQESMMDDPYFAHLALGDEHELEDSNVYSSGGARPRTSAGTWYAITGGEHEGAWLSHDFKSDIQPYIGGAGDVRCYGPLHGVRDEDSALAKVESHAAARTHVQLQAAEQDMVVAEPVTPLAAVRSWLPRLYSNVTVRESATEAQAEAQPQPSPIATLSCLRDSPPPSERENAATAKLEQLQLDHQLKPCRPLLASALA